jgi:hypothetical protein
LQLFKALLKFYPCSLLKVSDRDPDAKNIRSTIHMQAGHVRQAEPPGRALVCGLSAGRQPLPSDQGLRAGLPALSQLSQQLAGSRPADLLPACYQGFHRRPRGFQARR